MIKERIVFYTDCYLFGGSEKLIFDIISSQKFSAEFNYLLIYRTSKRYKDMMYSSWPSFDYKNTKEVVFFDIYTFNLWLEEKIRNELFLKIVKNIERIIYPILTPFLFLYEFIFLTILFLKKKATYIHINNGGYPGALSCRAAAIAAKCTGIKRIILSVHNIAYKKKGILDRIIDFLVKRSISVAITSSEESKQALFSNRNFDRRKIVKIYYGVEQASLNKESLGASLSPIKTNDRYISMVATFEERKGHKYAILALKRLIQQYPEYADIKLFLFGEGSLLKEIKDFVSQQRLEEKIVFFGYRNDRLDYVASSLFLISPSLEYESLPYSILEAMSIGVPVIGTSVGGIPEEIEDGITGIVIPPRDIETFVQAMFLLLSDNSKRQQMAYAAKGRFIKLFTLDKMVENYLTLYRKIEDNIIP